MSTIFTPDTTIKSFSAGHKIVSSTINGVSAVTSTIKSGASITTHSAAAFFGGMRYAITERRSVSKPHVTADAKRETSLRAARDLYRRAHPSTDLIIHSAN